MKSLAVALMISAATGFLRPAHAQVVALQNLTFGTILSGSTTTIAPTSASAAEWKITYATLAGTAVFSATLPNTLSRTGGGATMPITFSTTSGIYRLNNSNPVGGTTFNPATTQNLGLIVLGAVYYVWIGGTLSPPLNQMAGDYTGTIVLTRTGTGL